VAHKSAQLQAGRRASDDVAWWGWLVLVYTSAYQVIMEAAHVAQAHVAPVDHFAAPFQPHVFKILHHAPVGHFHIRDGIAKVQVALEGIVELQESVAHVVPGIKFAAGRATVAHFGQRRPGGVEQLAQVAELHLLAGGSFGVQLQPRTLEVLHFQPRHRVGIGVADRVAEEHIWVRQRAVEREERPADSVPAVRKFLWLGRLRRAGNDQYGEKEHRDQKTQQQLFWDAHSLIIQNILRVTISLQACISQFEKL